MSASLVTKAFAAASVTTPNQRSPSADGIHLSEPQNEVITPEIMLLGNGKVSDTSVPGPSSRSSILPGRVELLPGLGSQGAVLVQQDAGGHGARAQAGQQHGRATARDQTPEGARHFSSREVPQVGISRRRARNAKKDRN